MEGTGKQRNHSVSQVTIQRDSNQTSGPDEGAEQSEERMLWLTTAAQSQGSKRNVSRFQWRGEWVEFAS